ncbi:MAG: hypothetical protein ACI9TH_001079 [Kiritimatiellia bacterium]|jgi:hypothetical protein
MKRKHTLQICLALALLLSLASSLFAYRIYRTLTLVQDTRDHIHYLVEEGGSVGSIPSEQAFQTSYLKAVFGDNPELLKKLHEVIRSGLENSNQLRLEKVSAMLVTYRINENEEVRNLATHVIGDYKVGRRRPGFHRDGYFKHLIDQNLWNTGNTVIGFLGRDIVYYAEQDDDEDFQTALIDSLFTGEVDLILEAIDTPYYYTMVIPNPRRLLPPQLRHHIQTVIIKGSMQKQRGDTEVLLLCSNPPSARHTAAVVKDMKVAAEAILQTQFGGVIKERSWGPYLETWWAREMVVTSEKALLRQEENIVRLNVVYGRVMNNALLKSFERMGRDLRQITGTIEQKKDPRLVDAEMRSHKGSHYWSEDHGWGPNWPIQPPSIEDAMKYHTSTGPNGNVGGSGNGAPLNAPDVDDPQPSTPGL